MFSFLKKQKWALVKTFKFGIHVNDDTSKKCIVFFHLFESSKGNRKVEAKTIGINGYSTEIIINVARNLPDYQAQIYRWEHGRYDPEIPGYSEIAEEDTMNALRGKIE